ncbi:MULTISPECIES: type II secretion system minor pseudopilin GspK [unclassified Brevundimonas]|uniref:type II secretion system minor pseudopilin GspK n=1 Tax=unclassified Brevundimonas TaxID=2622653 RepID=UPI003F9270F4
MKARLRNREGMALLTVLLLVAVMAAVAVLVLDDIRFSVRRTMNAETQSQAQWYAAGAESLARRQINRLRDLDPVKTPIQPDWNGRVLSFPVEDGSITARLSDGQACFNLNSVVEGQLEVYVARPLGIQQFVALGRALNLPEGRMRAVADALTDWIDTDTTPRAQGGEDAAYAGQAYRTAGTLLAEVSELRAVRGVDAEIYARLRPYLCALPTTDLSPINPNTLTPEQAPLLVMLADGKLSLASARAAIAARPASGWSNANAFLMQGAMRGVELPIPVQDQLTVLTRFFNLRVDVEFGGSRAVRTALIELPQAGPARTVIQRWTLDE